jgi:hypothetical protein
MWETSELFHHAPVDAEAVAAKQEIAAKTGLSRMIKGDTL